MDKANISMNKHFAVLAGKDSVPQNAFPIFFQQRPIKLAIFDRIDNNNGRRKNRIILGQRKRGDFWVCPVQLQVNNSNV